MERTDDAVCKALIDTITKKAPLSAEKELRELCRFNTRTADLFWQEYMFDEDYTPYAMMSKNDHVSDSVSDKLNEFLDSLEEKTIASDSDALEAYYLLNFCIFKHTPRLLRTYRRIASMSDKLVRLRISWYNMADRTADDYPEFLRERMKAEESEHSEYTFLRYLNDILIITIYDDIIANGLNSRFISDISEVFTEYPDVFTPARFALAFVTDNSRAYDDFSGLRKDPSRYYELMWVLDGLFSEGGTVYHGSPIIMTGPDNKKHHIEMKTAHLDTRWLSFLCAAPFVLIQSAGTDDPYFARGASHRFSAAICSLILENKDIAAMMAGFFEDAVYHCGGMHDLIGLRICGNIKTTDDLEALFEKTTALAEKGKLACAPELITAVFCDDKYVTRTFTEEECIRALAAAKLSDK